MLRLKPQNSMIRPTVSLTSASLGHSDVRRPPLFSLPVAEGTTSVGPCRQFDRQDAQHVARGGGAYDGKRGQCLVRLDAGPTAHLLTDAHLAHGLPQLLGGG